MDVSAGLIVLVAALVIVVLFLFAAVKIAREYERGVIFRLGRLLPHPKGPGIFLLIPIVDRMVKVDLRTVTLNVPPQEVITKDNVPVRVNAVAYFRIVEPNNAIVQVENFMVATSQIAQTTLRAVLGQHMLDELLSERVKINSICESCGTDFERRISSPSTPARACSIGTVTRDSTSAVDIPRAIVWISTLGGANSGNTSTGTFWIRPRPMSIIPAAAARTRKR